MEPRVPSKSRRHYVSRACVNCRLRKVKCSGGLPCRRCEHSSESCEYTTSRRSHIGHGRTASSQPAAPSSELLKNAQAAEVSERQFTPAQQLQQTPAAEQHNMSYEDQHQPQAPEGVSRRSQASDDDLESIARGLEMLSNQPRPNMHGHQSPDGAPRAGWLDSFERSQSQASSRSPRSIRPGSLHVTRILDSLAERVTAVEQSQTKTDEHKVIEGGAESLKNSSIIKTIEVLEHTLRGNHQSSAHLNEAAGGSDFDNVTNVPSPEHNVIRSNVTNLRHALAVYFEYINPNLPILNENQFRVQFENFLVTGGKELDSWTKDLFVVLVNLMYAETMLLSKEHTSNSPVPGWAEFRFADRILSRLPWLNKGNLQFIQCLILRARILSTVQKIRSAYDTVSKAVQISYHIGLHDQQSYPLDNPFETTMRQRVFWSLFYLDHGIALNAGLPCLLRESDFNVQLPRSIEEKDLFPNRPLPKDSPVTCAEYVQSLAQWARLSARISKSLFGVNALKPPPMELFASLDSDILHSVCQLSPSLWWNPSLLQAGHEDESPPYIRRQMCLLHLHTNHLRLIMRHESIVTLKCSRKIAQESVWIAKDTVDTVESYRICCMPHRIYRHSSVMYLTAAIIPLICHIVQEVEFGFQCEEIGQSFFQALNLLQDMAPTFMLAQIMLRRLSAAIMVTKQALDRSAGKATNLDHDMTTLGDNDLSGGLTDLFREQPNDITAFQHDTFGTEVPQSGFDEDYYVGDLDMDMINVGLNSQFSWHQSAPIA